MKKFNSLLAPALGCLLVGFALLVSGPRPAYAGDDRVQMSTSSRVAVSSDTASPTTLFDADQKTQDLVLINNNTNYLLIGDIDTTFSKTDASGTFRIPGTLLNGSTVPAREFHLGPFRGAVKAVSGCSGCTDHYVDRLRLK